MVRESKPPSVRLLSGYLDTLSSTLDDLPQAAVSSARNAALELFVGALRPINPLDGDGSAALRTQMDRWLDRRLQDPGVNAELLARAHSVSVRTVHRIYGRSGETPSGVLRLRRLMRARDDLILSDFPIGMIA